MRLTIPAAILAAVVVWPSGVGAQELEDEEVAYCAAVTLAYSLSRVVEVQGLDPLEDGFLIANRTMYTKYIQQKGYFPAFEARASMMEVVNDELSSFVGRYDTARQSWSRTDFRKILSCYEKMSSFLLESGGVIIGTNLQKLGRISKKQASDMINQFRKERE
jgi:hypothetical protein